jgi:hypothetical protein
MLTKTTFALALVALAISASSSPAAPLIHQSDGSSMVVEVADGCGQGRYRGPGGACHRFGFGPNPGGNFAGSHRGEGCGPGNYRGPGGACHRLGTGPYPGGNWAPR